MSEVLYQGDSIITPYKPFFGLSHHAIFAETCSQGINWAIHNIPGKGVCWIKLDDLLANGYERIERFVGSEFERAEVIKRAKSMLGKPYSLLKFNCEHLAQYAQTKICESEQVNSAKRIVKYGLICIAIWIGYRVWLQNSNNQNK